MFSSTIRRRGARVCRIPGVLSLMVLWVLAWLRAEQVSDDRGSDSSEKAFMIILAIALGAAVTAGAVAFVNSKIGLFK